MWLNWCYTLHFSRFSCTFQSGRRVRPIPFQSFALPAELSVRLSEWYRRRRNSSIAGEVDEAARFVVESANRASWPTSLFSRTVRRQSHDHRAVDRHRVVLAVDTHELQ